MIADHIAKNFTNVQKFQDLYENNFAETIKQLTLSQEQYTTHNKEVNPSNNDTEIMNTLLTDLCDVYKFDSDPDYGEPMLAPVFVAMMLGIGLRWSIDKDWITQKVGTNTFVTYGSRTQDGIDPALTVMVDDACLNEAKLSGQAFPHLNFTPSI